MPRPSRQRGEQVKQRSLSQQSAVVQVSEVVSSFREELDEYKEVINENTAEIQTNFSYLSQIDHKIQRLTERLDELSLIVSQLNPAVQAKGDEEPVRVTPLTSREKEVFFALYTMGHTQPYASYSQLAKRLLMSESQVASFVACLVSKGVPIKKKYHLNQAFIALEDGFRELQARENVVGLNAKLNAWI
jgi:hypothetical protein